MVGVVTMVILFAGKELGGRDAEKDSAHRNRRRDAASGQKRPKGLWRRCAVARRGDHDPNHS